MKRIYVTLDTEMDSDIHWVKHYPAEYSSILEGIPRLLRPIWNKYQVHPIYFVSPEVLYENGCVEVLKREIAEGAIIGAHLHPEYIEPNNMFGEGMENIPAHFPCSDCSDHEEKEKLKNLTTLIEQKLNIKPVWYRAARFGADAATIHSLGELGYQYDSSVTPGINWVKKHGPNYKKVSPGKYYISEEDLTIEATDDGKGTILEVPVTILGKRFGFLGKFLPDHWIFYRWLRPTHMTCIELKGIVRQLAKGNQDEAVMMFHSMEVMVGKTPYVRNRAMQSYYLWRLEQTLKYASKKGFQL